MRVTDFLEKKKAADREAAKKLVMDAWDRLFPGDREAQRIGRPDRLDTNPEVRRKAKQRL